MAQLTASERSRILHRLAKLLLVRQYFCQNKCGAELLTQERSEEILSENAKDIDEHKEKLENAMLARLKLTAAKLESLSKGIEMLAKWQSQLLAS